MKKDKYKDKYKKWRSVSEDCYKKIKENIKLKRNHRITIKMLRINPITKDLLS